MKKKLPIFGIGVGAVCTVMAAFMCVNVVSALIQINETNRIIEENTIIPIEYEDETELLEGLTTYRYEAERGKFNGFTSNGQINQPHACPGASLDFNEKYSGGVALRNIFSSPTLETPNSFTFTVTSDKNVKINALLRCSGNNAASSSTSFAIGDFYQVKVNKTAIKITGALPGKDKDGLTNTNFVLPLVAGENNIEVITKPYTSTVDGCFDYLELYTTASLTGYEDTAWDMSNFEITMPPMGNRYGSAIYNCEECGTTFNFDSIPSINVGLEQGLYEQIEKEVDGEKITEYYFKNSDKRVSSNPLPKEVQHKLTIESEYVTFADGSKTQDVWEFYEFPEVICNLEGYNVSGWYVKNNKTEVWESKQFAMPKNDLTVVPVFDSNEYKADLEKEEYEKHNEGKPKEEWEASPKAGSFNGKINLNDINDDNGNPVDYKPIHSSGTATTGFNKSTLRDDVTEGIIYDTDFAERATLYKYSKVEAGWTFLTCSGCKMVNKTKTIKVKMQNQGKSALGFDFWFTTSSGNPTNNGNNPHVNAITLQPNEVIKFELDVKFSNTNLMSYFKFNVASSELKLAMIQYVEDVSQAASHQVTINNIPNSKYTVMFEKGNTAQIKEGKSLIGLNINAPENYILDGFMVDDDRTTVVSTDAFVMGNKDVTLTPVFRYSLGGKVDLTQTIGNGSNYIHGTGLSGFNRDKLSGSMKNEIVLKDDGEGQYYEVSTLFGYEGGLSDTSKTYSFIIMAGYKTSGRSKVNYILTNSGTETLRFTISQPNSSGNYASESTAKSEMIELAPGETKIVSIVAQLGNSNVLGYFAFDCHTTTDMALHVSEYIETA